MDHFRKASESNKNIESIRCNECYQKLNHTDSNIIQARCSISHFLCKRCYDKTAKTSKNIRIHILDGVIHVYGLILVNVSNNLDNY